MPQQSYPFSVPLRSNTIHAGLSFTRCPCRRRAAEVHQEATEERDQPPWAWCHSKDGTLAAEQLFSCFGACGVGCSTAASHIRVNSSGRGVHHTGSTSSGLHVQRLCIASRYLGRSSSRRFQYTILNIGSTTNQLIFPHVFRFTSGCSTTSTSRHLRQFGTTWP